MGLRSWWKNRRAPVEDAPPPAASGDPARLVADCADRERVRLRGLIIAVTADATGFTAGFTDGTATVDLVWMGRRAIPGITEGAELEVSGRLCLHDDRRLIYNPAYELTAGS